MILIIIRKLTCLSFGLISIVLLCQYIIQASPINVVKVNFYPTLVILSDANELSTDILTIWTLKIISFSKKIID